MTLNTSLLLNSIFDKITSPAKGVFLLDVSILEDTNLFQAALDNVSMYRQAKVTRIKMNPDKRLSLGAGLLIDYGLKHLVDLGLADINLAEKDMSYEKGENEKPYFKGFPRIHFNASHSGSYAVVIFSDCEVGIDIQEHRHYNLSIAKRYFTQREYAYLEGLEPASQANEFFRLWSLKESYIKFTGQGVSQGLDACEFVGDYSAKNCCFEEFTPVQGYSIAVCRQSPEY